MSTACGSLDSRGVDIIFEKPTLNGKKLRNGLKVVLYTGSEDVQDSDGYDTGNIEENGNKHSEEKEPSLRLSPVRDGSPHKSSDEEDEEDFAIALQLIFREPSPVRLISAMKGSREKQGLSARKLSVKWAPDVYDPPPSLASHTRCKIQLQPQQQRSKSKDSYKRSGKKGQKGSNSSRKDKKHSARNKHSRDNFHMSNPEAHCAGSFLRSNPTKVHLSVTAQAL